MTQQQPYSVNLDQETARELTRQGAAVLVLDFPEGACFGIDSRAFVTGPRFQGVKMIPPGAHFISTAASDAPAAAGGASFAPVTGELVWLERGEVLVRRWDTGEECLAPLESPEEAERYVAGVRNMSFDAGMAPYDLRSLRAWRSVTGAITSDTVRRVRPVGGLVSITAESDMALDESAPATPAERELVEHLRAARARTGTREGGAAAGGAFEHRSRVGRCFYVDVARLHKSRGLTAEELTRRNMDRSWELDKLVEGEFRGEQGELLGELQAAFACFVAGQSLDGFRQWRALLEMVLRCPSAAVGARSDLFEAILNTLHMQLQGSFGASADGGASSEGHLGGGSGLLASLGEAMERDSRGGGMFLRGALRAFFRGVEELGGGSPGLKAASTRLKAWLAGQMGWNLEGGEDRGGERGGAEESDEEDGPVVVELTEEQMRELGLARD
ncbi:unnamed protein product [Pedinophyceae sp. YPF-701]|nr:unnamed protein product [Pedinophyceae sp. YPF-701]